jgi:hypothetical protein
VERNKCIPGDPPPSHPCPLCGGTMRRHDMGIPYCKDCGRVSGVPSEESTNLAGEEIPPGPPEPCKLDFTPEQQQSVKDLQWMVSLAEATGGLARRDAHGNERTAFEVVAEMRLKEIDLLEPLVEDAHRRALKHERAVLIRRVQQLWSQRLAEAEDNTE